jgi:uncharacterized protein YbaP (TraB family)
MRSTPRLLALAAATALACSGPGAQRAPAPAPAPAPRPRPQRGPFLWQVDGASGPSYLFGTIHAGFQAERELPDWVWDRLASCDTFVMEMDPTGVNPFEIARMSALPEGQSLEAMLGPTDWKALVDAVGAPPATLARLQPWAAMLFLVQKWYPTPLPLDEALRQRAVQQKKRLAFLETWQLQAEILQMTTIDELREMLRSEGGAREQLAAMVAAYRAGDFDKLAAIALDPAEIAKNPARHARLFDERNRAWIGVLAPHLERGRTFVAVGAGHFAGDGGLLALLRARGLEPRRVQSP